MKFILLLFVYLVSHSVYAQVNYPYAVHLFNLTLENKSVKIAYMDVRPTGSSNGKTIILFHGKNFNGYYWKDVIPFLAGKGYRVIAPDLLGWGRSDKPDVHYSFHMLAAINRMLLDSLKIDSAIVLGHSMGGMVAIRFALLYPALVSKLVLEDPIGLEDYRTFVPYQPLSKLYAQEKSATYESYKKYQQSYYPTWQPEYEQYVKAQAESLLDSNFGKTAWANAVTYQMIYEQPVIYETEFIHTPTLLIIGQADRTIVGKELLNEEQKNAHGQYPVLGERLHHSIKGSTLIKMPGVGHIPHIQNLEGFKNALSGFL